MILLTKDQRRELENGHAVDVTDAGTSRPYVVLPKDVYERVRYLLYDDLDRTAEQLRQALARSAKENGWQEPGMEAYDRYDEERAKRCP